MRFLLVLTALAAAGCNPNVTGAPCDSDANCPTGQHCVDTGGKKTCQNNGGGGGGSATGGGSGVGGGSQNCNGMMVNTQTDPANCGMCGVVCAQPLNASPACYVGHCGRGPCMPGTFDIDGAGTLGCESTCNGRVCTLPDGGVVNLNNDPLPETGLAGRSVVNGASLGSKVMTDSMHTNFGSMGEATPAVDGGIEVSDSQHRHRGGFGGTVR